MATCHSPLSDSTDSQADEDTDDITNCTVCLIRFNSVDRKPKFLDCHHYFCLKCITLVCQGFSKGKNAVCPACRHTTKMSGRKIEDLATNNIALRLITINADRVRKSAERKKEAKQQRQLQSPISPPAKQQPAQQPTPWCVECSSLATSSCQEKQHIMCCASDVYSENFRVLEGKTESCCRIYDSAMEDRQSVQRVYEDVLKSLQFLQLEVRGRVEINDGHFAVMLNNKQTTRNIANRVNKTGAVDRSEGVDQIAQLKSAIEELDHFTSDANRNQFTARQLLKNLATIEENCVDLSFTNVNSDCQPLRAVGLLKRLQLSFKGTQQNDPLVKACVSVLSYLVLRLAEEQSKQSVVGEVNQPRRDAAQPIPNPQTPAQASVTEMVASRKAGVVGNSYADLVRQVAITAEDDKGVCKASREQASPNEWARMAKQPPKAMRGPKKCFFIFSVDGERQDRVVIQLERDTPIMSGKFIDMCTARFGYQGSRIFRNVIGECVMGGSRWFHDADATQRKDLFIADKAEVKEKRGSIRFPVKEIKDGKAEVSTEFLIILNNRPSFHKYTTVFGQVVDGLPVLDEISQINLKQRMVLIAECGTCQ